MTKNIIKSTTIIGIRKEKKVIIAGDGQATLGNTIMKANVKKVRRLGTDESLIAGFAGSTADAFALSERLELVIKDKELRSRMAEQSLKEYKKGFTLDKTFENTFAIYEETIESKRNLF